MNRPTPDVEEAVRTRYSAAAADREDALCCPVQYDTRYLDKIPQEILDRDYGCGDPSRHVRAGETVLDLGSGGGKICYIASQVVGAEGRVLGVDMNDDMLKLAERHRKTVGDSIGWHNVSFHKARIQDLALDYRRVEAHLAEYPVVDLASMERFEHWKKDLRRDAPLVADDSVDVVVSNCVLNLVRPEDRRQLFRELNRVLRRGGRAVISDIVSDEEVPLHLRQDPELWSGCISGAYREDAFLEAFADAGFYGMRVLSRDVSPWRTVEGIEFRSLTVEAFKGKEGPCLERRQAVIYRGPWRSVTDDDGHTLQRGQRTAVCDKSFTIYTREPYGDQIEAVPPRVEIPLNEAPTFDGDRDPVRNPRETKGTGYDATDHPEEDGCGPSCC